MKRGREVFYKYTVQGTPLQSTCVLRILVIDIDIRDYGVLSHTFCVGVYIPQAMATSTSPSASSAPFINVCDKELSEFLICKE